MVSGGCLLLIRGKRSLNIIVPSSLSLSPSPLSCYTSLFYCLHHFTLPVCRALGTWSLDTFPWFRSCLWRTSRSPEFLIRLICKHSPNARCVWYIYQELPPKLRDMKSSSNEHMKSLALKYWSCLVVWVWSDLVIFGISWYIYIICCVIESSFLGPCCEPSWCGYATGRGAISWIVDF